MATTRKGYIDPRATYGDFQDYKYPTDAPALDANLFNRTASLLADTIAKGAPRAQDTPDMTIYVPAFQAYINGALVSFAGGNSGSMSAPSANPRIDRVYLTSGAALAITTGAEAGSPTAPALVANTVPICLVYHRVGSVHIDDADDSSNSYIYRDDRPLYQGVAPMGGAATAEVPFDAADGKVTICTVPAGSFVTWIGKIPSATPYDAGTVTIGSEGDEAGLMSSTQVGAQSANSATKTPQKFYAAETVIKAFVAPGAATEGSFTIKLKYE